MAWPSISDVTGMIKGAVAPSTPSEPSAESAPATPAAAAPAPAETTDSESTEPTVAPSATEPAAPAPIETPSTDFAKLISEKGAKAFIAELPDDIKEKLGPELNKAWYSRLNERDNALKAFEAKREADKAEMQRHIDVRIDELLTTGMSDEEKQAFTDRRDLERLRAKEKVGDAPAALTPEQEQSLVANHPATAEFWRIVTDAGLPRSTDDPRVRAVWQEAFHAPTPDVAVATMRSAATRYASKPAATTPAGPTNEELLTQRATEMAEAIVEKKLREAGILRADTGKPGASGGAANAPKTYEEARRQSEELFRQA